jgi:hypothetical protein
VEEATHLFDVRLETRGEQPTLTVVKRAIVANGFAPYSAKAFGVNVSFPKHAAGKASALPFEVFGGFVLSEAEISALAFALRLKAVEHYRAQGSEDVAARIESAKLDIAIQAD